MGKLWLHTRRIAVAFHGPDGNILGAVLPESPQGLELAGKRKAGLFLELPFCRHQGGFPRPDYSFGKGPGPLIPMRPNGTAHMNQENFNLGAAAVENNARTFDQSRSVQAIRAQFRILRPFLQKIFLSEIKALLLRRRYFSRFGCHS